MDGYTGPEKNVFINTATAWLDLFDTAYDSIGATTNEWTGLNITGNTGFNGGLSGIGGIVAFSDAPRTPRAKPSPSPASRARKPSPTS